MRLCEATRTVRTNVHRCWSATDHDVHECVCGHRWTNDTQETPR